MDYKILTSRQYFKSLMLIYGVMLVAQVGTGMVFFFLRSTQADVMQDNEQLVKVFQYLVPLVAFIMPVVGWWWSRKSLKNLTEAEPLSDKLRKYQSNLLLKYAFFEGPTLLVLVAYFLTGQNSYLAIATGLVLGFSSQIPTRNRLFDEIPLSPADASKLNDPETEVAEMPIKD